MNEWRLVEADHLDRPNRRDWRFIYEHKTRRIGDAPLRMQVTVKGEEVEGIWRWWEVPEAWEFEREQFAGLDKFGRHLFAGFAHRRRVFRRLLGMAGGDEWFLFAFGTQGRFALHLPRCPSDAQRDSQLLVILPDQFAAHSVAVHHGLAGWAFAGRDCPYPSQVFVGSFEPNWMLQNACLRWCLCRSG
jgi:hypothetical protein